MLLICVGAHGDNPSADNSTNVPIDHWVYGYLDRCESLGLTTALRNGIKPFTRLEVSAALNQVHRTSRAEMSLIERRELDLLRVEFAVSEEMDPPAGAPHRTAHQELRPRAEFALQSDQPLLHYGGRQGSLFADMLVRNQIDVMDGRGRDQTEQVFRNRLGAVVWGEAWGRIGFRVAFAQTREQGTRNYHLRGDVFERRLEMPQLKGNRVDYHEGTALLSFAILPQLRLEVGKGVASWGPVAGDNLVLSNNAPAFDMIRLRGRFGALKLVSIAGTLRPCPDRPDSPLCAGVGDSTATYVANGITRALDRDKQIAAHRLEVSVAPWLDVGFHEVLVYGDRGPQLTYLNPIMFYWAAQSYQGDKDNLMMGVDFDVHPGNGMKFYLAYAVDDLKKLRVFSDDFANKFSLQTGFSWLNPASLRDTDIGIDYTRIEPWIYTHKFPINTFRHFDSPLGHSLGPNADHLQAELRRRLAPGLAVSVALSRTRKGSNQLLADGSIVNVGGDLHRGWRPGDERSAKKFLEGNLHTWTGVALAASWRLLPRLTVTARVVTEVGDNVPLPPRAGTGVALENRSGYGDGTENRFSLDLRCGYL